MIAPPHLIIFTRETKPGTHKPIRFLVPFAISFITNQCDDVKLNKAIFLHHTILCLYCYFNFVSQREDCFGQVWYVIVFPSKWHFIVCISVLNVYGNKIELLSCCCSVALAYTFFKNRLAELDGQIWDSKITFAKHAAHKV